MNPSLRLATPRSLVGPRTESEAVSSLVVAVLVPCLNEVSTIATVVHDFQQAIPGAVVYVFDNNSTDGTAEAALAAGAAVRYVPQQGKGQVVRRMFADVEADIYLLVDGDDTYSASSAPALIDRLIQGRLDMVVASRVDEDPAAYRRGHRVGNRVFSGFVAWLFGR